MAELISIRIGIKSPFPLFPHAGVVVTEVTEKQYEELAGAFLLIQAIVPDLAGKLVLEKRDK